MGGPGKGGSHTLLEGITRNSMEVSKEHKNRNTICYSNLSTGNKIIMLFTIVKIKKQPGRLSTDEWIKNLEPILVAHHNMIVRSHY